MKLQKLQFPKSQKNIRSANHKSAKCHICRRFAKLTKYSGPQTADFAISELICRPPTLGKNVELQYPPSTLFCCAAAWLQLKINTVMTTFRMVSSVNYQWLLYFYTGGGGEEEKGPYESWHLACCPLTPRPASSGTT